MKSRKKHCRSRDKGPASLEDVQNKLVDYLSRRDHSELELKEKLGRFFEPSLIEAAIAWAHERKFILPPEELAHRVAEQLHRRNKGYLYILQYLQSKGLPAVERDAKLELEKARELAERKFPQRVDSLAKADIQKLARHLAYRGFESSTIGKVCYESF